MSIVKKSFDQFELDKMRKDPTNYILGIFYFNKKDFRVILPKRNAMLGWTLNFARIETYLLLILAGVLFYFISKFA